MRGLLNEQIEIDLTIPLVDQGLGSATGSSVHMAGFSGALFIAVAGDMAGPPSDYTLTIEGSDDDGDSDPWVQVGEPLVIAGGAFAHKLSAIDLNQSPKAWLRALLDWDVANTTPLVCLVIRYGARKAWTDWPPTVADISRQPAPQIA